MPIKFPCPHCKKVLSVKDHLAGKKGPCPACKKILTVPQESPPLPPPAAPPPATNGQSKLKESAPAPGEPPPIDAEAAAAAAFADEPSSVGEAVTPQFIDFNCPQCDEPLHLSAELAGKRAPCPECKRIIKVPELKKIEKADWRKTNAQGLPSGARRPDEPVPEGAWGTATSAGTVSREALEEAEVLPDRYYVPLTVRQKVARGMVIGVAVVSALVFVSVGLSWWFSSREASTLKTVQDYANSPAATEKIGREGVAALDMALGEYFLRSKKPLGGKELDAPTYFAKALETLAGSREAAGNENERDASLADLALLQIELGGSKNDVDEKTRLRWDDAQKAIGKTLRAIHNPEARLQAYRAVCRRLIDKKEAKHVLPLGRQLSDAPGERAEAVAVAGLELLAANQKSLAEEAAGDALSAFAQSQQRPLLTPPVVALAVALKRTEWPEPKSPTEKDNDLIGQAEGLARQGNEKIAEARQKAELAGTPYAKLQAYIALAAASDAKSDNTDLQNAIKIAVPMDPPSVQQRDEFWWLKLRLVELALQGGVGGEQLDPLIASIKDTALASRARLAVLRSKLAASKNAAVESPLLSESPPTLSHYLAVEMIARHNRKFDASKADDAERAFGIIGTMLGN